MPPSADELKRRLVGRGTEDAETIRRRLEASGYEMGMAGLYQHQVVNHTVEQAAEEIGKILHAGCGQMD